MPVTFSILELHTCSAKMENVLQVTEAVVLSFQTKEVKQNPSHYESG